MKNSQIKEIMTFLGYDLIRVGYWGNDETKWQQDNKDWMEQMGMDSVGDYFVSVNRKEYYDLYNNEWDSILPIEDDWNWIMKIIEEIETIQLPTPSMVKIRVEISANSCRIFKGEWNDNKEGFIYTVDYGEKLPKKQIVLQTLLKFIKWYNHENIKNN